MTTDPRVLVDAFLAALTRHDYEQARTFLADEEFGYRSPIAAFQSADDFIQYATLSGGIIQAREIRKVFVDGGDVCHFMTFHIQISEKQRIETVQWARVESGRIRHIEVLFDASPYHELFAVDPVV